MVPGISLGSDSLGLGGIFQGIGTARASSSVAGCGNRPLFGKKAKQAYNDCLARNQELQSKQLGILGANPQQTPPPPNNNLLIIGGLVVAIIILILIFKK